MKRHSRTYILLIFLYFLSKSVLAQELNLKISSKDSIENEILKKIGFKLKHFSKKTMLEEIGKISDNLKSIGYFNHEYSFKVENNNFNYCFNLKKKTNTVVLLQKKTHIKLKIQELKQFLKDETAKLDNQGNSFSSIKLENIQLRKDTLYAHLKTRILKKRFIDKVIIKGYDEFPESYIENYFSIKKETTVSKRKISEINNKIKSLQFVKPIKKPELLFSKDSTVLYLYLKKENKSNFDGLINFTSEENKKGIKLNGHVNLLLNNTLNSGETFEVSWKSFNRTNQSLKLFAKTPYLFNTPLTPSFSFELHKQDSTFLNSTLNSKIAYTLNYKSNLAISYNETNSTNTLQVKDKLDVNDYSNYFLGLSYDYEIKNNQSIFSSKRFHFKISPLFGSRRSKTNHQKQLKIKSEIENIFKINNRNSVYIKNEIGYLNSKSYLINELFRIGGPTTIRGFNEQSYFAKQYTFINAEYRYKSSKTSQLYALLDYAYLMELNNNKNYLTSLGAGYKQLLKNTLINIEFSLGKSKNSNFNFDNSFLSLKLSNYF